MRRQWTPGIDAVDHNTPMLGMVWSGLEAGTEESLEFRLVWRSKHAPGLSGIEVCGRRKSIRVWGLGYRRLDLGFRMLRRSGRLSHMLVELLGRRVYSLSRSA